ncbi:transposase family protein [Streptomyces sp. NRRL F-5126]|uniref:transposase family protein n=1 Tax=Streptomyces sp. NRRL F-5126 TaxID=1463857 RepID=UPI00131D2D9E
MGDGQADYSHTRCRHGVNVQVVTNPVGQVLWVSPSLPGRCHDLTAARRPPDHPDLRTSRPPRPSDRAYQGAGSRRSTGRIGPPGGHLASTQRTANRALATSRAPVQRDIAPVKSWRIFRRSRISPNRMTSVTKAILTLERQR